ncbi:TonB-dependent siderophore receptor [Roseateles sp.]|uniref:TonB-dependent siderophore receptor n=1 Tax=Roseateles sp. TaxID=1971397 RepID=UPI0039E8F3DF
MTDRCSLPTATVRRPQHRHAPLALAALLAVAGASATLVFAPPAYAAETTAAFDIPAGALNAALHRFIAQSGVFVAANGALTEGHNSAGLQGRHAPADALERLLTGTGLEAVRQSNGSFVLKQRPPAPARPDTGASAPENMLPLVRVKAGPERERPLGPVAGYVASRTATATKTDTALLEVPQSISVIGREEMDAHGAQDIMAAIRYTPGVSVNAYGPDNRGWEDIMLRGFSSYYASYRDGLAQTPFGIVYALTEPYGLERVEVLRGPASMTFGQGDAGGIINRVSKQATGDSLREVEVQFGSHQRKQLAVDLANTTTADEPWAFRVVAVGLDSDDQDRYPDGHPLNRTRAYLAPSLRWQPDTATSLTLFGEFIHNRSPEDPYYIGADYVLTSVKMGDYSFSRLTQDQTSVGYRFEHRFDANWTVRQVARHSRIELDRRVVWVDSLLDDGHTVSRVTRTWNDSATQTGLDTNVQGKLRSGSAEHTLLFGIDWNNLRGNALRRIGTAPDLDLLAPVYGQQISMPQELLADYSQHTRQLGIYAQDQSKFGDRWVVTLGGRQDEVRTVTEDRANAASTVERAHAFSGRGGVTYLLGNGWAPYLSYAESFLPNSGVDGNNQPFKPSRGKQVEVGIKYQPEGSRTYFAAAVFDLRKTNVVTYDNVTFDARQIGRQRSRGLELEVKTELSRDLSATASYTRTQMKVLESADSTEVGKAPPGQPRQAASAWLDYNLGVGFGISGGVNYVGRRPNDEANSTSEPGFTLLDAAIRYEAGAWRLALNVSNLLDKKYFGICYHGECYRGQDRAVTISARYRF